MVGNPRKSPGVEMNQEEELIGKEVGKISRAGRSKVQPEVPSLRQGGRKVSGYRVAMLCFCVQGKKQSEHSHRRKMQRYEDLLRQHMRF